MQSEPRIELGFVTLGVADVEAQVTFFEAVLGAPARRSSQGLVQFELARGVLGLMPAERLAELTGVAGIARDPGGQLVSLQLASAGDVQAALARVAPAGGRLTRPGQAMPWGAFAGFFEGPEGHAFEFVAHEKKPAAPA